MRYLPLSTDDRARMLATIGAASIDELFRDVPESARLDGLLDLPPHMGEQEVERVFAGWAAKKLSPARAPSFLGAGLERGGDAAVIESVKAARVIYAAVSGEVTEVNGVLEDAPTTINSDPMGDGRKFKVRLSDASQLDDLMNEAAYKAHVEEIN